MRSVEAFIMRSRGQPLSLLDLLPPPRIASIPLYLINMPEQILEIKSVGCSKTEGQPIFTDVNFTVNDGDIVVLQGKSGAGYVIYVPVRYTTTTA